MRVMCVQSISLISTDGTKNINFSEGDVVPIIPVGDGFRTYGYGSDCQFDNCIQFFKPIEDDKVLRFKRLTPDTVNEFINNSNHTVKFIKEPDNSTIDIYYTDYLGEW